MSPSISDLSNPDFGRSARRLRLDTLVRLRWLAVAGQTVAVLFVYYGLGFGLPLAFCLLTIAASAALNIALRVALTRAHRLDDRPATFLLAFDIFQIATLLYLTGGIENPFTFLMLAPVVISAVSLPRRSTAALFLLLMTLILALSLWHLPLPWAGAPAPSLPPLYRAGLWIALAIGAAFVCVYAGRVAEEARLLSDALTATELVLAREQHLSQIDGLAAAAAHELGTPLATIALVVKEIARQPDAVAPREDIDLLLQQTQRCRDILKKLRSLDDEDNGGILQRMALGVLMEEVSEPHRHFDIDVRAALVGHGSEPTTRRSPGVLYGLGNLIENAVDFARAAVAIQGVWTETTVTVSILDDGPGFAPEVRRRVGEPYVTTRADARKAKNEPGAGLGLGLFIAKTLLERSGATVTIDNRREPETGAAIHIVWPRAVFEGKEEEPQNDAEHPPHTQAEQTFSQKRGSEQKDPAERTGSGDPKHLGHETLVEANQSHEKAK